MTTRKHAITGAAFPAILLGLVLVSGCAKVPQPEVDAARQALESARQAGAPDYAPEAMRQAEEAVAQLDAELQAQEKRFALTRSYKNATELAKGAVTAGETAVTEAAAGKEVARSEAETLLGEARMALEEAKGLLAQAPAGKGTQVDLEALRSDLSGVEAGITEADRAYQEGRFHEARTKAEAAKTNALRVKTDVESARAAKRRI